MPPGSTCNHVLEVAILELIDLARQNEMTEEEIDAVLTKVMADRTAVLRRSFKVLGSDTSS
jgi:hypothetical protein